MKLLSEKIISSFYTVFSYILLKVGHMYTICPVLSGTWPLRIWNKCHKNKTVVNLFNSWQQIDKSTNHCSSILPPEGQTDESVC